MSTWDLSPAKSSHQWKPCLAGVGLPQVPCWLGQGWGKLARKRGFGESRVLVSEPSSRAWSTTHSALGSVPGACSCPGAWLILSSFNSRFELQAIVMYTLLFCSNLEMSTTSPTIQLPHGHSNLSCIKSL